jgi:hypothetical protein
MSTTRMKMNRCFHWRCLSFGLVALVLLSSGCLLGKGRLIVLKEGYAWPSVARDYWPTAGWRTAQPGVHGIDVAKLSLADDFARKDSLTRSLLVVQSVIR